MKLVATAGDARALWEQALEADASAVVSQTPAWLDAACASGRLRDATRAYESSDGRVLVLPLARVAGIPRAIAPVASLPFGWGAGGLARVAAIGIGSRIGGQTAFEGRGKREAGSAKR